MDLSQLYALEMMRKRRIAGSGTLSWSQIASWTRANTLLSHIAIGDVVDLPAHDAFPALRYKLAHVNYTGGYSTVAEFHETAGKNYNSIWIPNKLPCRGTATAAYARQFDAPELEYAVTWDITFIANKAYYKLVEASYVQLTAGTDYTNGASIADWTVANGDVYTKNNPSRIQYGSNRWKESNIRQWLNSSGSSWFEKQNEYDQLGTDWLDGWLSGVDTGLLGVIQAVKNQTARNTIAAISGGGGGGTDTTLDMVWLPGTKEVFGSNTDGVQFDYFSNVATTSALRIQRDEGGTARYIWVRTARLPTLSVMHEIWMDGTLSIENHYANNTAPALLPCFCIA